MKKSKKNTVNPPPKPTLADLRPADLPDYAMPAWIGCMSWALSQSEIMAAFREDTGNRWEPGRTPLDRMIDESTGAGVQFVADFVKWANEYVWGPWDAKEE